MQTPLNAYRESRRRCPFGGLREPLRWGSSQAVGRFARPLVGFTFRCRPFAGRCGDFDRIGRRPGHRQRPPDKEHPYGHGRVEAVAGACAAPILLALSLAIAYESVSTMAVRYAPPSGFTLVIAGGGAIFQELLYRYVSRVARRTGSTALLATAWDYRLDGLGGIGVLIGVCAGEVGRIAVGRSCGRGSDCGNGVLDRRPATVGKHSIADGPPGGPRDSSIGPGRSRSRARRAGS